MKTKITFKSIIFSISAAIILFFILFFVILSLLNKKPVAAFYGIPENTQKGITAVLQKTHTRQNKKSLPYEIVILNDTLDLKSAIKASKKPDILFIYNGRNAEYAASLAASKKTGFDSSILNGMTTSVKATAYSANGKITGVPLLIDNYEIDVNLNAFKNSGIPAVNFWNDIERLAEKTKSASVVPVLFSAGNDEMLINVFGALVESLSGVQAWNSMTSKLKALSDSGNITVSSCTELISQMAQEDGELYKALSMISSWKDSGLIPKNITQITFRDINAYMAANLTAITFMTLSQHRTIEYKTISQYSSIYYPSLSYANERHFAAPVVLAVPLSQNKIARNSVELMANTLQPSLCSQTGLAPAQANCSTPDKQSDDVRYWVAASGAPLPALCDAAFTKKTEKAAFASALRSLLK